MPDTLIEQEKSQLIQQSGILEKKLLSLENEENGRIDLLTENMARHLSTSRQGLSSRNNWKSIRDIVLGLSKYSPLKPSRYYFHENQESKPPKEEDKKKGDEENHQNDEGESQRS